ncbi:hypothetical protein CK203_063704 [Vitis vinifera]|uniref:Uncharacterized protein n=1 Tax=Vitis vinifera TaxID=29760 RepID=A0A438G8Q4_VITVI|nr:hypothetical protein CK203_063704 [Vitis vinifera]
MRKIWPSEANCSRLVRKFRTIPCGCANFAQHLQNSHSPCVPKTSEDVFPEDERLNFWFLGVKEARITLNGQYMVSSNLCMPYWIRDQEGRLVRIENRQDTELDICVNIMDPPPEDQNSQHGQGGIWRPSMLVLIMALIHGSLVSYFYDGMSSSMKQILETMCGGDFMSKNSEEAMDFLSYVSEVSKEDGMSPT